MDNFTGIKNGKPIVETSSKYTTYSKQGSTKKESNPANDIVKGKKKQDKK